MKKSKATEAHRVATDIAALKTALNKQGYITRKRPKQAAWTITPLISCPVEYLHYRWRQGRGQKAEGRREGARLQGTRE